MDPSYRKHLMACHTPCSPALPPHTNKCVISRSEHYLHACSLHTKEPNTFLTHLQLFYIEPKECQALSAPCPRCQQQHLSLIQACDSIRCQGARHTQLKAAATVSPPTKRQAVLQAHGKQGHNPALITHIMQAGQWKAGFELTHAAPACPEGTQHR